MNNIGEGYHRRIQVRFQPDKRVNIQVITFCPDRITTLVREGGFSNATTKTSLNEMKQELLSKTKSPEPIRASNTTLPFLNGSSPEDNQYQCEKVTQGDRDIFITGCYFHSSNYSLWKFIIKIVGQIENATGLAAHESCEGIYFNYGLWCHPFAREDYTCHLHLTPIAIEKLASCEPRLKDCVNDPYNSEYEAVQPMIEQIDLFLKPPQSWEEVHKLIITLHFENQDLWNGIHQIMDRQQ
jgi:hypothetical protein